MNIHNHCQWKLSEDDWLRYTGYVVCPVNDANKTELYREMSNYKENPESQIIDLFIVTN